jgi:hypothetical protein
METNMNGKNSDNMLDLLEQVKRVEAPPFLYTRIEARLGAIREPRVRMKWILASSLSFAMLLLFNLYVVKKHNEQLSKTSSGFSYLVPKNSIYE